MMSRDSRSGAQEHEAESNGNNCECVPEDPFFLFVNRVLRIMSSSIQIELEGPCIEGCEVPLPKLQLLQPSIVHMTSCEEGTTACRIRSVLDCSRIRRELKSIGKTLKYLSMNPSTSVDPYFAISRSSCRSVDCIADTFPRFFSAIGGHSGTMKAGCCPF